MLVVLLDFQSPVQKSILAPSFRDNHLCLFKMERKGVIPLIYTAAMQGCQLWSGLGWVCCCWSLTAFENSIKAKKVNGMGAIFVVVVGFTNGFKIHNNSLPSQQMGLDILYYSDRVSVVGTSINDVQFQGRQEGLKLP